MSTAQKFARNAGLLPRRSINRICSNKSLFRPALVNQTSALTARVQSLQPVRLNWTLSDAFTARNTASRRVLIPGMLPSKCPLVNANSFRTLTPMLRATVVSPPPGKPLTMTEEEMEIEDPSIVSKKEYVPAAFDAITAISPRTRKAINTVFKYKNMSKVQEAVLSRIPIKDDLLVKAKTGTGKTLAFLIPAIETTLSLQDARARGRQISVMVISPTRELAYQIAEEAKKLVEFHPFEVHCLVGGESKFRQLRQLHSRRVDVVIGTPGRLQDLLENEPHFRKQSEAIHTLILDEADQLLDMGFCRDIERIIQYYPRERQTFLFSATVSREIRNVARFALKSEHVFIDTVDPNDVNTNVQVSQQYIIAPWESHIGALRQVVREHLATHPNGKIIAFLPTKMGTMLYAELFRILRDVDIFEIHSGKNQDQRSRVSERFRKTRHNAMLVTSDVSARGVDYPGVTLVLQIGVPSTREQYIHRLGRTGRAGKEGEGMLVMAPFEKRFVREIDDLPIKLKNITPPTSSKDEREALQMLDESLINDAYRAFLGYYSGKLAMLSLRKDDVLDAAGDFYTNFGLSSPPPLSSRLRQALGLVDGRQSRGSDEFNRFGGSRPGGSRFGGSRFDGGSGYSFNKQQRHDDRSYSRDRGGFSDRSSFGNRARRGFGGEMGGYGRTNSERPRW